MNITSMIKRAGVLLALPGLLFLAACDRHDHDDDHFGQIQRIEVSDRATNNIFAIYVRGEAGDQFQGQGVPPIGVGEEIALNVDFIDVENRRATLSETGEYRLGVRLATQQRDGVVGQPGIVEFSAHGDHADVEGEAPGQTHIVFQLMHGNHSDADSPPLLIVVEND
jgi:hypothetical protein